MDPLVRNLREISLLLAMDVPTNWSGRNVEDYLVKLREGQATLVRVTREFLKKNQRKRAADGRESVK
jgi:hypothetical protein